MDLAQLKELIKEAKSTESTRLEFKESTASMDKVVQTLSAFLNGEGGTALIGVRDNGEIIGQHVSDTTQKEVTRKLLKIEPKTYEIQVKYIEVGENKQVIVLQAPVGQHKPYLFDGRSYWREGKETHQMPKHLYDHLVMTHLFKHTPWEELPAKSEYRIEDLDHALIHKLVGYGIASRRLSDELAKKNIVDLLQRFNLLADGLLKQAAIILFAKETFPAYPQCGITMARFLGNDKTADMLDNKHFYGNVFAILAEAENFIARNTAIASHFPDDKMQREDKPQVPVKAMKEALVNALCHTDYSQRECSIMLQIFNDRLMLWNTGTLINPITIENIKTVHQSKRRNRLISEMFYKFDYFEGNATGIDKILTDCQTKGYPEPVYEENTGGLMITFYFPPIHIPTASSPAKARTMLNLRQEEILKILKEGNLSTEEIGQTLIPSAKVRAVQRELKKLEEAGYVQRVRAGRIVVWRLL